MPALPPPPREEGNMLENIPSQTHHPLPVIGLWKSLGQHHAWLLFLPPPERCWVEELPTLPPSWHLPSLPPPTYYVLLSPEPYAPGSPTVVDGEFIPDLVGGEKSAFCGCRHSSPSPARDFYHHPFKLPHTLCQMPVQTFRIAPPNPEPYYCGTRSSGRKEGGGKEKTTDLVPCPLFPIVCWIGAFPFPGSCGGNLAQAACAITAMPTSLEPGKERRPFGLLLEKEPAVDRPGQPPYICCWRKERRKGVLPAVWRGRG